MKFDLFFMKYVLQPEEFWPKTHLRNVKKIKMFLDRGRALRGDGRRGYVENIVRLAHLRTGFEYKHLYLVNAGSSGSHWVEAMLGLLPGFYNGGEIYFPKEIKEILHSLSAHEAGMFLDAAYLLHAGAIHGDSLGAAISNSAHLADHGQISRYSKNKVTVLLQRNPVDVVMSRTFRKDEYRKDVASTSTENEYLEKNCSYVERFYNSLDFASFDMVVKYEEFLASPKENLEEMVGLLNLSVSDSDLDNAILKTSKDEVKKTVDKGGVAITNIYLGEKKEHDWARDYVKERLSDVIYSHGFS